MCAVGLALTASPKSSINRRRTEGARSTCNGEGVSDHGVTHTCGRTLPPLLPHAQALLGVVPGILPAPPAGCPTKEVHSLLAAHAAPQDVAPAMERRGGVSVVQHGWQQMTLPALVTVLRCRSSALPHL